MESFGVLPAHISIFPSVDQIAVLEKADVFLSHCGMNSAGESLYFGVPLVMLPKTSEQGGVAARIAQLGAGTYLERAAPAVIRETVERVLHTPSYREHAQKIGAGFRNCGGAEAAADKIERICEKSKG